ncbi:transporter family-2 protein [Labedella gwakjiensis]|uniref:Transporter family-2 protein n=1 Tax=Labedella gwakjiensis TaxID=390269 RepID=A0A2P8GRJ2_9MICO|nr:DMT family transporter [Labedella gwakjiensis]PSL36586.1 transporter family-2 protein [Labedella gwakjiensis]
MTEGVKRAFPQWLGLVLAVVTGTFVAAQARINGALGAALDDGFAAAAVSFGSGLIILTIVMGFSRPGRRGLARVVGSLRDRTVPWWTVAGGAAGAFLVLSQGIAAAALGVALFTVAIVAGQTISSLVLDRIGFGPHGVVPFRTSRVLGSVLALVAVAWAVSTEFGGDKPLWLLVMPLLGGIGIGWQQAVNGRVRQVASSALTATFINFTVGTVVLLVAMAVHFAAVGLPDALPSDPILYIGGAIGCVFIGVSAFLVSHTGLLVLGLGTVAGQLVGAVLLDLLAPGAGGLHWTTVAGAGLALVAVAIASIRR